MELKSLPETIHTDYSSNSSFGPVARYLFSKHRLLLTLFTATGFICGLIYFNAAPKKHLITATLLVENENKSPELKNIFHQPASSKKTNDIEDQIGLLKSYHLNRLTLDEFSWPYHWSKRSFIGRADLFPEEPFSIKIHGNKKQTTGIPIQIASAGSAGIRITGKVESDQSNGNISTAFDQTLNYGERFKNNFFDFTIEKLSNSESVLNTTYFLEFKDPDVLANQYKQLLEVEKFNPTVESNLIRLKLSTTNLDRDVAYINKLMEVYLQYGIQEKNKLADQTIRFIDDQISGVNRSLESAGKSFTSFRTKNKTVNLNLEANSIVNKQNQLEQELNQADNRLNYYQSLKRYLENGDERLNAAAPVLSGFTDDALKSKVERLNELSTKRQVLSMTAQEKNPVLITLENEISFSKEILLENILRMIDQTEAEKQSLVEREKEIRKAVAKLPSTEKDMIGIKRDFDLNNDLYTLLLERKAEAQILRASNNSNARILDPASKGTALFTGPVLAFDLFIGTLAGLLIGIGFVAAKYFSAGIITDAEEIRTGLAVAPIGEVIQADSDATDMRSNPRSALAESIRGLRINLSSLLDEINGKVIAIHSILPGSGKSFVAKNLAMAFGLQNKRVLLIDADLKRPTLDKLFNQTMQTGLIDFLNSDMEPDELIQSTSIPRIDLLPAGPTAPSQSDHLDKLLMQDLLNDLVKKYDVIIIDNAPFGLISDPRVIGTVADLNLFLIRIDHSKKSEIRELNQLGKSGTMRGITVAINGTPVPEHYGYYGDSKKTWKEIFGDLKRWSHLLQPAIQSPSRLSDGVYSDRNSINPPRSSPDHNL